MSIDACADLVRAGDPDRYLSAMAAPVEVRERLLVLYAFNLEVARAPWASSEELIAEMRLQWWLDTVNDIYDGKVRPHEVVQPLSDVISTFDLPRELFVELIEARRFDVFRDGHANRESFDIYIRATSTNLIRLVAMSLGVTDTSGVISNFGHSVGVANLWRALPTLFAYGRHPVPVDCALDRNAVAGGEVPENLKSALEQISVEAIAKLKLARIARGQLDKAATPAMLVGWQAGVVLNMVGTKPTLALSRPLETSEFRKKSSLLWRSATGRW